MATINNNLILELSKEIIDYQIVGDDGNLDGNLGDGDVTNTTAIVNAILDFSKKTRTFGYIVRDESFGYMVRDELMMNAMNTTVIKCIMSRMNTTEIKIPTVVIECKHYTNNQQKFDKIDFSHLFTYMSSADFPVGVLISEFKAIVFQYGFENELPKIIPLGKKEYKLPNDLVELVELFTTF